MVFRNLKVVCSIVLLTMFMSAAAAAQISNGSFEDGNCSGAFTEVDPGATNIDYWTVGGAGVDYICTYWEASEGSRSVDLNQLSSGSVSQDVPTIAGYTYLVTFDLSGNPDGGAFTEEHPWYSGPLKEVGVSTDGSDPVFYYFDTQTAGNTLDDMKWNTESYLFVAGDDLTTLLFESYTTGAFGPALDNVTFELVTHVCHRNMGKAPYKTLSPDLWDVADHIGHGDEPGPCPTN